MGPARMNFPTADPKVHYGSDFPFTPADDYVKLKKRLDDTLQLSDELRRSIYYRNTVDLLPRLADLST